MTRNADTPDTPVADRSRSAAEATPSAGARTTQTGPVAELGLVAAGLGVVIYLIAFVADVGRLDVAGRAAPARRRPARGDGRTAHGGRSRARARSRRHHHRCTAPRCARWSTTASALVVGALVLALLEAAATVGATLMQAGVVRSRPPKERARHPRRRRSPVIPRARSSPGSSTRASPTRAPTPRPPLRRRTPATSGRASTPTARTPSTGSSTACPATRRRRRTGPLATTPPCTARSPRRSPSEPRRPIMTPRRRRGDPPRDRAGRRSGARFRIPVRR